MICFSTSRKSASTQPCLFDNLLWNRYCAHWHPKLDLLSSPTLKVRGMASNGTIQTQSLSFKVHASNCCVTLRPGSLRVLLLSH